MAAFDSGEVAPGVRIEVGGERGRSGFGPYAFRMPFAQSGERRGGVECQ
jgi:hypothetical protein